MKMPRTLPLRVLAFVAARAVAAPFEGKIDLDAIDGKKSFTATFRFKGDKMRVERSEGSETGAMNMDLKPKMILMPS